MRRHIMPWYGYIAYFFGGAFLCNGIPHFISGVLGRPFQSPFSKPPGEGLSSSTVNMLWGSFNFTIAYLLLVRVGAFDLHNTVQVLVAGLGALAMGFMASSHFGKFHGGNI